MEAFLFFPEGLKFPLGETAERHTQISNICLDDVKTNERQHEKLYEEFNSHRTAECSEQSYPTTAAAAACCMQQAVLLLAVGC